MDCIFCKIIAGEIPSYKVYETDKVLAFLDINPVNPGHTLVIPKQHFETLLDTPQDIAEELIKAVKIISPAVIAGVKSKGFNLALNNGKVEGQLVPHVHFHIIPRFEGDGYQLWKGIQYKDDEAEEIAETIKNKL